MKVLWICNVPVLEVEKLAGHRATVTVSWLENTSRLLADRVELCVSYPYNVKRIVETCGEKISYYAVPCKNSNKYNPDLVNEFATLYNLLSPDVIHIFGTEFPHAYCAVKAAESLNLKKKTVITIQGLVGRYADQFKNAFPRYIQKKQTLRTFLLHESVWDEYKLYSYKAKFEKKAIELSENIIGRTNWDNICTQIINPRRHYYHNNEILRGGFYSNKWSYDKCRKYSIYLSQGTGTVKGLWNALEAIAIVKQFYPETVLITTARDIFRAQKEGKIWLLTAYEKAIIKKAKKLGLIDNIEFRDVLGEKEVVDELLSAHVSITPSIIENSPNSMGEAMLLGTPIVAADVGGVSSLVMHGLEGFLYPYNEPYMLAFYIMEIFKMKEEVIVLSNNEQKRARITHNIEKNIGDLVKIYGDLQRK